MTSSTRDAINRANSLHSTGPRTIEGKERAAMNALKHGLTGQRLILQPEEHDAYRELHESLMAELEPKTTMELQLVQKIIDTQMRLNRAAALDNNMLNLGLLENLADTEEGDVRATDTEVAWAQSRSFIAQQLSFDKLGRYEARLSRQLIAYTKELERLQTVRNKKEEALTEQRLFEARGALIPRRIATLRPPAQTVAQMAASTLANPPLSATKGEDLSPQNLTAQQNHWSLASFGTKPETPPDPAVPDPRPEAA